MQRHLTSVSGACASLQHQSEVDPTVQGMQSLAWDCGRSDCCQVHPSAGDTDHVAAVSSLSQTIGPGGPQSRSLTAVRCLRRLIAEVGVETCPGLSSRYIAAHGRHLRVSL